jgi:hypothetical protein
MEKKKESYKDVAVKRKVDGHTRVHTNARVGAGA